MTLSKEAIEVAREIESRFTDYVNTSIAHKKSIPFWSVSLEARRDVEVDMLQFARDNLSLIVKKVLEATEQKEAKHGD